MTNERCHKLCEIRNNSVFHNFVFEIYAANNSAKHIYGQCRFMRTNEV